MDVISKGPLSQMVEWTFESAKEAMENKPYKRLEFALNTISILGVVIAGVLALGALIQFSAVLLAPAALVLITAAALKYVAYTLDQSADEGLAEQGLTSKKKAELFAARFKETIATAKEMDVEFIERMEEDIGIKSPFYDLLQVRFNPFQEKIAQFSVRNDELSDEIVDDLLITAYSKGVILHFTTLEQFFISFKPLEKYAKPTFDAVVKKWENVGFFKRVVPEANLSALISARFVANCFKTGDIQVEKMNQQLNALGFKYIDTDSNYEAKAVKPAFFMEDEDTLIIRSLFGEVGDLKRFLLLLNVNESRVEEHNLKTIKVQGDGFYISQRNDNEMDEYETQKSAFKKEIKGKNHGVEIIFEKLKEVCNDDLWQEGTPRSTFVRPSMDEALEYDRSKRDVADSNQEI